MYKAAGVKGLPTLPILLKRGIVKEVGPREYRLIRPAGITKTDTMTQAK